MHWTTTTFIILIIEIALIIVLSKGIFLLFRSIKRVEENLKKPLTAILISFLIYLVLSMYVAVAVAKQFSYENFLWTITFVLGFFVGIFLVIGAKRLLQEIEKS